MKKSLASFSLLPFSGGKPKLASAYLYDRSGATMHIAPPLNGLKLFRLFPSEAGVPGCTCMFQNGVNCRGEDSDNII